MKSIVAAIEEQEKLASGSGALAESRQEALDHYLGRPYGDEEEGRSQVVMRDVADTIEWIKPSLLKIFCSGDEVCAFEPVGPEDEKQAEQETDYVNHVVMRKNNGFLIFHDWFHDALLQKNGYVWAQAVKEKRREREPYQDLSDDALAMLLQEDVEVVEHTEKQMPAPDGAMVRLHDVVLVKEADYACIKVKNIPPERVAVAADWPNLDFTGCPFLRIIDYPTISDLRSQGYDVDDNISDSATSTDEDRIEQSRDIDGDDDDLTSEPAHPAARRVKTRYVWMLWDEDEDGIAELHHYVVVGNTILDDEVSDLIPVAALTPGRMPHEHDGQSIDDMVSDLQRIRTVLVRGFLDNMYLANNGRNAIDASRVNLDDMLTARPGGVVRVQGDPGGAIMPLIHPQVGGDVLQAVEYIDSVRENRTGVTRYNQGLDANSLNKTATGVNSIMNAAQQRIELIARMFAETGVKHLMLIVHALVLKNGQQQEIARLRNQWVPVNPRSWKHRTDMNISVGLGTGNKDQNLQHLTMIWQMQTAGMQFGIATPANIFETAKKLTMNAGFKQPELFWTDPRQQPPQQQQPDPAMLKVQAEIQGKQAELQMKAQSTQADIQHKQQTAQIDLEKARVELQIKQADLALRQQALELKREEALLDAQIAQQRAVMHASDDMARAQEIRNDA